MPLFPPNSLILFQGDSITDCGRFRDDPRDLGKGYAHIVANWLDAAHPALALRFLNRGVSGDRVRDLARRWDADCLDLRPALVSLLVGVNDVWRTRNGEGPTDPDSFEADYRDLLARAADGGARLLVMEPFVVARSAEQAGWRAELEPKIECVRRLAAEFGAIHVALDDAFARAAHERSPEHWAADGVHPSNPGHALIARAWLDAVGEL